MAKIIMADKENSINVLLSNTKACAENEIVIIGSEESVLRLAEKIANFDARDNATAVLKEDILPDFAGETITCISDTVNIPFSKQEADAISEILLRHLETAVDTVYHVSPFDLEGMGARSSAKMLIIDDPFLAHYGMADADTLLRYFNCNIHIISPMDVMFEDVASSCQDGSTFGIICNKESADAGIHSSRLINCCRKAGKSNIDCAVFPYEDKQDPVRHFLDKYIASGFEKPLSAIMIDGVDVDPAAMKAELADLLSLMNEESLVYRKYIAEDFKITESDSAVIERCYDLLRSENMFSHRISMPTVSSYYSIPAPFDNGGSYILIPGSYVQD